MLWRRPGHGDHPGADLNRLGAGLTPALPGDAPQIAEICRRFVEHGLAWRWRAPAIAACIRDEDHCVLVARQAGVVCGFAVMSFDFETRRAHLVLLAVVPGCRRRGLATALLEWLEVLARRGGIRRIALEVRETARPARGFYARQGFRWLVRLRGYYQGREDALRLEKRLG